MFVVSISFGFRFDFALGSSYGAAFVTRSWFVTLCRNYSPREVPHCVTLTNSRTAMQEVDDQVCRRLRLLFRDPVPAIRDDHIFDVVGDTPHNRADHRAECSFATEGQDRHLKLALRKERPVVGRILAERQELGKARSHCAGLRIERRIMLALRLVKPLRVPGKFVPEAVEINALAAGDEALHVLTTEAKVPHGRILCD